MDAVRKALDKVAGENNSSSSSSPSSLSLSSSPSLSSSSSSSSLLVLTTAPRQGVSYWQCSTICAIFFAAGAAFGYTLRGRRVRRWASKVLKRLTDN